MKKILLLVVVTLGLFLLPLINLAQTVGLVN